MPLSAFSTLSMHAASLNGSLVLRLLQHKPCTMTTSKKNRNTASTDVLQAFIKLRAARGDDCEEDVVLVGDGRLLLPAARTKAGSRRRRRRQTDSQTHTHTHTHTPTPARAHAQPTHTHTHPPTHARMQARTRLCILTEAALPSLVDRNSCSDSTLTASSWHRRSLACITTDNTRWV